MKSYKIASKNNSLKKIIHTFEKDRLEHQRYIQTVIERVKTVEPVIRSFVQPSEIILNNLEALSEKLKSFSDVTLPSQPLYGIPVGIKDIYQVDGFTIRAGSALPANLFNLNEGYVVKRLKELGAYVIGKTVTTEFAYFAAGPTRNPNNIDFSPGGSSSGSAAAVAAGIVPLAFGTQTIGSIIRPAAFCGVVGFKPTQGRIPTDGIFPLSPTLDQVGFFTSDIDSAILVSSLFFKLNPYPKNKYLICIPKGNYFNKANLEIQKLFRKFIENLNDEKLELVEMDLLENIDEIIEKHFNLIATEAAKVHNDWFEKYKNLYHPKTVELIETGKKITDEVVNDILLFREKFKRETIEFFNSKNIDAIITPSTIELPPWGLSYTGSPIMNLPWTFCGLPSINIPAGYTKDNLPFGVQIVGSEFNDEIVLEVAKELENHTLENL